MTSISPCQLPTTALLRRYGGEQAYSDCFVTEVNRTVALAPYVEAFYTTALFKVERFLLRWFASLPSTDLDASQLAEGSTQAFSAWRVEDRTTDQLLLSDVTGRTRSWLMVAPPEHVAGKGTRLFFGSAVLLFENPRSGEREMGFRFRALLGFHNLYSRLLLSAARARLLRQPAR